MTPSPRLLYCHCRYAQVVPAETKREVLRRLCDSATPFEAVPDLCELSARRDPLLAELAAGGPVKIAACYPRAVKWLFANAGAPLPEATTQVLNMRTDPAAQIATQFLEGDVTPNLPAGKAEAPSATELPPPAATP